MKHIRFLFLAILLLALPACGKGDLIVDNSATAIAMLTQEYAGENIAEIPIIAYDAENPQLEAFDGENPEIERINDEIRNGILETYNNFIGSDPEGWIEIRAYPFSGDDYLQIVMTHNEYPVYGSEGRMWSYNFDRVGNRYITLEEELAALELTEAAIAERVGALYEPESGTEFVGSVVPVGFLILNDNPQILLEVTVENSAADPWTYFYAYLPEQDEMLRLNSLCLFDPADMDVMDPPLSYGRAEEFPAEGEEDTAATGSDPGDGGFPLSFDTAGLEESAHSREYFYDGAVLYGLDDFEPVAVKDAAIVSLVRSLESAAVGIQCRRDEALGARLSYPVWTVTYTVGQNEDMTACTDVIVQTDTMGYRLHTAVAVDLAAAYADEIQYRIGTLTLQ